MLESDLLIESLGENVDTDGLLAGGTELDVLLAELGVLSLEQSNLGKDLVGERAGHDEGRVAGGTAKVDETTLGQQDDVAAVGHGVAVNLGLDVLDRLGVGLEPGNVDLNVEVTDVCAVSLIQKIMIEGTYCKQWRRCASPQSDGRRGCHGNQWW